MTTAPPRSNPPARRPNILLITSDQQHFSTLGFANPHIKTPALDRLAREGTNFTRAYCTNPTCTPSRASIITGLYPAWHHAWSIGCQLPHDVPTVGAHLAAQGYDTTLVGKAHFQPLRNGPGTDSVERQPLVRDLDFWRTFEDSHCPWYGFQHVETCRNHGDESHVGGHYAIWMEERGLKNWRDYFLEPNAEGYGAKPCKEGAWALPPEHHYTTWTAERTIAHLDRCAAGDQPFFLWSSFHDPHPPYLVPEPWASMYDPADMPIGQLQPGELETMCPYVAETQKEKPDFSAWKDEGGQGNHGLHRHHPDPDKLRKHMAIYYGMTSFMGQQIGRILDKLDELGIADNTLVVFTTDHGHFLGQHGLVAKAFMYDDNTRLPFLARFPGRIAAGGQCSALQSLVDLAPTFLQAAGAPVPGLMQGVNQLPVWEGQLQHARTDLIVEHRHQPTKYTVRSYVNQRYKLNVYRGHDFGELFDLQEDPGEIRNRWSDPAYADVKHRLMFDFLQAEMNREPTRQPRVAGA